MQMIYLDRNRGSRKGQGARGNNDTIQGPDGEISSKLRC
jgi:hypothetical protein